MEIEDVPIPCSAGRSIPRAILWIILTSLAVKLFLINLNAGEYTDGIIQLQLWQSPVVFFPPGYSAAVWFVDRLVGNLLLSGRLVSILASLLALFFFYRFAARVFQCERSAILATLFLALSPIFNRWSLRVMTDSMFCLFFILCCDEVWLLWSNPRRSLTRLTALTGFAALIRYQGLFFVPIILYLFGKRRQPEYSHEENLDQTASTPTVTHGFQVFLALLPWLLLVGWVVGRGFGHTQQFMERAFHGSAVYFYCFEGFLLYWPWAVTYPLFILGLIGGFHYYRGNSDEKRFLGFVCGTAFVFLTIQTFFLSFQFRYLLPLLPLWCLLAARGYVFIEKRIHSATIKFTIGAIVILTLSGMSGCVLYFQRDTFGDLVDSAKFLKDVGMGARVLSDEVYGRSDHNVKMRFWSDREIFFFPQTPPQAGDILILHNAYSDFTVVNEFLRKNYEFVVLRQWNSAVNPGRYVAIPFLPDIMVEPPGVRLTSNPACMAFRFTPQHYNTIALRIISQKEP
ncbi:MAG: hypothetical protein C4527_21705 [Candidatus Omnitrophota bacterium]|nr:MAG: hypothetical protein C4527_21705 [Candidatus Omnitrophota bacterium]